MERTKGLWTGGIEAVLKTSDGKQVAHVSPDGWEMAADLDNGSVVHGVGFEAGYSGKLAVEATLRSYGVQFARDWQAEAEYLQWWISKLAVSIGLPIEAEAGDVVRRAMTRWASDGPTGAWVFKEELGEASADLPGNNPASVFFESDDTLSVGIEMPEDQDRRKDFAWVGIPLGVVFKLLDRRERGSRGA